MVVHTSILSHLGFALFFRHFSDLLIYRYGVWEIVHSVVGEQLFNQLRELVVIGTQLISFEDRRLSPSFEQQHHRHGNSPQLVANFFGVLGWPSGATFKGGHFHFVCLGLFAGQNILPLDIAVYHEDRG